MPLPTVGVALSALLVAASPALGCFLENVDYPGFDVDKLEGKVTSAVDCQRQCLGRMDCEFWTYVASTSSCYMKSGGVHATPYEGAISGPRICPGPVECAERGLDLFGSDIINTRVDSDLACQYQCNAVTGCQFWTFIPSTKMCYLKGENVEPRKHEEAVSGPRVCPTTETLACEYATDFMGHDIQKFHGVVADVETCQQLCKGFNSCSFWTYVQRDNSCYLKDKHAQHGREYNSEAISGSRDCDLSLHPLNPLGTSTTTSPPPSCLLQDTDYEGADITAFGLGSVTKPDSCQLICQYTRECFYFTFFEGTCYFKTAGAPERTIYKAGAVSGPKFCESDEAPEPPTTTTTTTTTTTATTTTRATTTITTSSSSSGVDGLLRFLRAPTRKL